MKVYNKLVRDKVPSIIAKHGKEFSTHKASEEEYLEKLKEKLLEEVEEFLEEPCLEELADIFEVFSTLIGTLGHTVGELRECAMKKVAERGAFSSRIILESVED